MPKQWTPEERKAAGERLRAAREAKLARSQQQDSQYQGTPEQNAQQFHNTLETKLTNGDKLSIDDMPTLEEVGVPISPDLQSYLDKQDAKASASKEWVASRQATQQPGSSVNIDATVLEQLLARLERLEQADKPVNQHLQGKEMVTIGAAGQTLGVITKFPINPDYYPDPTEGLYALPEIAQYAPKLNYHFDWKVEGQVYETKFGTNIREPFFYLTISMLARDAQGNQEYVIVDGERRLKLYKIKQLIMNEDEQETIRLAQQLGIDLNTDKEQLMDTIRFERLARMVKDVFFPKVPDAVQSAHQEVIVDGKPVTISASSTAA